ncbi:PmeII family type II restriction endonuclease [Aquiflexum sp.]|uniref:PmeII family type II restriction endonuclease n=1 Tax=Aquiflexum sp. TaxID=1872584 RepID=UPI003593FC13
MKNIEIINEVEDYVRLNIGSFHKKRIEKLDKLKLKDVLKKKNPYLFKAKNVLIANDMILGIVDAFVSSSEEGIFGEWLEGLAIFVNEKAFKGRKSGISGIDLEFDHEGIRNIVTIKSGPNWGNDSQIKKMVDNFNTARKVLKTSGSSINVKAVNGCCYGRSNPKTEYKSKGDYYKLCGQTFWEYVSGDKELYKKLIVPIGFQAKERNDEFIDSYSKMVNKFVAEFSINYCKSDGSIDWEKLIEFNSKTY